MQSAIILACLLPLVYSKTIWYKLSVPSKKMFHFSPWSMFDTFFTSILASYTQEVYRNAKCLSLLRSFNQLECGNKFWNFPVSDFKGTHSVVLKLLLAQLSNKCTFMISHDFTKNSSEYVSSLPYHNKLTAIWEKRKRKLHAHQSLGRNIHQIIWKLCILDTRKGTCIISSHKDAYCLTTSTFKTGNLQD